MLYIVATPIGNLQDITLRALEILKTADIIAAEDTRHTLKLLNHFEIKNTLMSFHEHSTTAKEDAILELLEQNKNVALVSDAGTPLISDPGNNLVRRAVQQGYEVLAIPGACAAICALTLSALPTDKFIFEGFLPKDNTRKKALQKACAHEYTTVLYESPHKLLSTLGEISKIAPQRQICVCKELTKIYETVFRGTAEQAIEFFENPKGEFIIILSPCAKPEVQISDEEIKKELLSQISSGKTNKDAIACTASLYELSKNRVYKIANKLN